MAEVLHETLQPIDWKLKDALTLVVWKALTASRPWDTERHVWSEIIANDVLNEIERWRADR